MENATLSAVFDQMADIMEILGEDRFRINSYRRVARAIGEMPTDVSVLFESGRLAETPGIGKSSLAKIEEFIKTGAIQAHQELLTKIPPSLLELLTIPGVGPKTVKTFYHELHIQSIADQAVAEAVRYIREHACGEIRVDRIAAHVALSYTTLKRRFRRVLSRSVHDEITRARIERGRELLIETKMMLPQIAEATGFCHQAHFGAVFKSQTGMTPSQFRKENAIHAPSSPQS